MRLRGRQHSQGIARQAQAHARASSQCEAMPQSKLERRWCPQAQSEGLPGQGDGRSRGRVSAPGWAGLDRRNYVLEARSVQRLRDPEDPGVFPRMWTVLQSPRPGRGPQTVLRLPHPISSCVSHLHPWFLPREAQTLPRDQTAKPATPAWF